VRKSLCLYESPMTADFSLVIRLLYIMPLQINPVWKLF